MTAIQLKNIRKTFGKTEIIKGVNLEISPQEFVVFVGPSGCGKSTLLRIIAGLEDITSGELFIGGTKVNDLPPAERSIAMVFQSYALYPHMTVRENMAFGLKLARKEKAEIDRRVKEAAEILQITHLLNHKPRQLSGGQRQRVAIGRAIVRQPGVFLFDEPLSNLDASLRVQTRVEIAKLHEKLKTTMVYVTHDQVEAMTLADKIVVLRDGLVEQAGKPLELYHHPANMFVAGFIGSPQMNFISCEVLDIYDSGLLLKLPGNSQNLDVHVKPENVKVGDAVQLGVRPEDITLGKCGATSEICGKVSLVESLGGESYVYVTLKDGKTITARVSGETKVKEFDDATFSIRPETCHVFRADQKALKRLAV